MQLRLVLNETKPPIWRRFLISDGITFRNLHRVIQVSMGWADYHLHEFGLGYIRIGMPDEDDEEKVFDSAKVKLRTYLASAGQRFRYAYDFGDSWLCDITVEKVFGENPNERYPQCITGKLAGPCEDCGGISGHYNLIEVLADKDHPEHESMKNWAGEYDSNHFDIEEVNQSLEQEFCKKRR